MNITQEALLDALAQAAAGNAPEDARTVTELHITTGRDERIIRDGLRLLKEQGRLRAFKVKRVALDDVPRWTTAYLVTSA